MCNVLRNQHNLLQWMGLGQMCYLGILVVYGPTYLPSWFVSLPWRHLIWFLRDKLLGSLPVSKGGASDMVFPGSYRMMLIQIICYTLRDKTQGYHYRSSLGQVQVFTSYVMLDRLFLLPWSKSLSENWYMLLWNCYGNHIGNIRMKNLYKSGKMIWYSDSILPFTIYENT